MYTEVIKVLKILFSSETRVKVLSLFITNPKNRFYLREIIKLTHAPHRAVQRELKKLESTGLLLKDVEGNRLYFQINSKHFIFPELKNLVLKTVGFGDALKSSLLKEEEIEVAFIYGSYAENKETAKSDIDLFVIGKISGKKLQGLIKKTARTYGRPINPVIYSSTEFKAKKNSHFINSILKKPKIMLVGNLNAI
jgi:predicted nucleotidyltransferase